MLTRSVKVGQGIFVGSQADIGGIADLAGFQPVAGHQDIVTTQDVDVALAGIMDMVVDGGDPVRLELVEARTGELIFGPAADDDAIDPRVMDVVGFDEDIGTAALDQDRS